MSLERSVIPFRALSLVALLAAGLVVGSPGVDAADDASTLAVGRFSTVRAGTSLPEGWKPLTFPKIPRHTDYSVVTDDGISVVRADSRASASGLVHPLTVDLKEYPILSWRWKISNVIQKGDVHSKAGDDYPARIYITFQYDSKKVGLAKRAKYMAGRLVFGDIPIAAINYVWDNKTLKGTVIDNAYTDFVKMIVMESGAESAGKWMAEERNLYQDYKQAFGEEPPPVNGVAIMTDTDNTGESATAYYGDIVFRKASKLNSDEEGVKS